MVEMHNSVRATLDVLDGQMGRDAMVEAAKSSNSDASRGISAVINAFGVVYGTPLCGQCKPNDNQSLGCIVCRKCVHDGLQRLYAKLRWILDHVLPFLVLTADKHRINIHNSLISYANKRCDELASILSSNDMMERKQHANDVSATNLHDIYHTLTTLCTSSKPGPQKSGKATAQAKPPKKTAKSPRSRGNVFGKGALGRWLEDEYKGKRNVVYDGYEDLEGFLASDEEDMG